ncbi:MAG: hypothetical protein NC489_42630 [Ruminococcus flavefaciens]|nr:hypothetical protein [Ruminococcus flavefaciens]
MKNFFKAAILSAAALCCSAALLAGCSGNTLTGEYEYEQYGTNYGVKVQVAVGEGNVIEGVRIVSSGYTEVSPAGGEWTEDNVKNWNDNVSKLLKAYEGKTVDEILAIDVATAADGAPLGKSAEGFNSYDGSLIISGATVGSGRVLLAVQNALKDIK